MILLLLIVLVPFAFASLLGRRFFGPSRWFGGLRPYRHHHRGVHHRHHRW